MAEYSKILYNLEVDQTSPQTHDDIRSFSNRVGDPKLPLEIQEHIISQLRDDKETLKSCSLTCWAWAWTTRSHLSRPRVALTDKRSSLHLLCLLEESQQVGTGMGRCIQQLQLSVLGDRWHPNYYMFALPTSSGHRSRRFDLWRRITGQMPNVTLLSIRQLNLSGLLQDFSELPDFATVQDAISSTLKLPNLKAIHFSDIKVGSAKQILHFVGAFPHVDTLRLCVFNNEGQPGAINLAPIQDFLARHQRDSIQIQELLVHGGDCLGFQAPEMFSVFGVPPFRLKLKRLSWTMISRTARPTNWEVNRPQIERIFYDSQSTLEDLQLAVDVDDAWLEGFDLSSCYNLKVIALSIRFAHENENNWPNIPSFLSSITSTRISTIVLTFNAYTCDHLFTREFFNWRHLNDAIISVHKRCPMAALDVAFCYVLNVGSPPEVREDLLARLAPVHEAGMRVNIATHVRNEKRPPILFW